MLKKVGKTQSFGFVGRLIIRVCTIEFQLLRLTSALLGQPLQKVKDRYNGQQKRSTLFSTLLLNKVNGEVASFTTHESNMSCNKSGCCSLRKVFAECRDWFYFLQQNLYMLRVLLDQRKLVLQHVK